LRDLFGLGLIEQDAAWYLLRGRANASRIAWVTEHIDGMLLPRLRPHALNLVQAFGLSPALVRAPLVADICGTSSASHDTPNHNI